MTEPFPVELIANYGFAVAMAIMLFRFIQGTLQKNTEAISNLEQTTAELRMEMYYQRDNRQDNSDD